MKLELTVDEINTILSTLGKAPYESVFQVVHKIQEQAQQQAEE